MTVFEGYMRQYLYDKWMRVQRLQPNVLHLADFFVY